jgi:hypothetical protein
MKILILIMSHETNDSSFINYKRVWDDQIKKLDRSKYNIEFKFLYSNINIDEKYQVNGNNLITKCVENYWYSLALKVMSGFDYFLKNDFDLVFKTNLSTIINFEKFYSYCDNILNTKEFIYDGVIGDYQDYRYCSGAGMLLNKNSVSIVLNNIDKLNEVWTDDIFIGFILNKLNGIQPCGDLTRYDIHTTNTVVNPELVLSNSHIRIKVRSGNHDEVYTNLVYKILEEN